MGLPLVMEARLTIVAATRSATRGGAACMERLRRVSTMTNFVGCCFSSSYTAAKLTATGWKFSPSVPFSVGNDSTHKNGRSSILRSIRQPWLSALVSLTSVQPISSRIKGCCSTCVAYVGYADEGETCAEHVVSHWVDAAPLC
jgi:hypothetical protein